MLTQSLFTGVALATLTAVAAPAPALADGEVRTFQYTGAFTEVDDPDGVLGDATGFEGIYRFNTSAIDQNNHAQIGDYAAWSFSFNSGGAQFTVDDALIRVTDDFGFVQLDEYFVFATPGTTNNGYDVEFMDLFLGDAQRSVWSSDELVTFPPNLGEFEFNSFAVRFTTPTGSTVFASGIITAITLVPAPGALALLGAAGLITARGRRRI